MAERLVALAVSAAEAAGRAIMGFYDRGGAPAETKADGSPVTAADHAAEAVILQALAPSGIPVVSEESVPGAVGDRFWCVDPLDGTKEFLARTGDFTVCIALVERGYPLLGVLHTPVLGLTFTGAGPRSATRQGKPIQVRPRSERPFALVSRSHRDGPALDHALAARHVAGTRTVGSALKFGLIAAGEADLYVRLGPTSEWDTAAGQAVLEAAGGRVNDLFGRRVRYGKPGFLNAGFVAEGGH